VSASDVLTDASGRAAVQFTLPATPGEHIVRAWAAGGSDTLTFRFLALEPIEDNFVQVVAGEAHTCALDENGAAFCWGENNVGELGAGLDGWDFINRPVRVAGGHSFRKLAAGHFGTTCGVTTDDDLYCWGYGNSANLGNGDDIHSRVPVKVAGDLRWKDVGVGTWHTCGVTTDGAGYCWGDGSYGSFGNGSSSQWSTVPVPVTMPAGVQFDAITAGEVWFTCALSTTGQAYCWGSSSGGVLGIGSVGSSRTLPTEVVGGHTFTSISAGQDHVCAATGTGAYCWGWGGDGQLGTGDDPPVGNSGTPLPVAGSQYFHAVEVGEYFSCALTDGNRAHCWGGGWDGQLGNGLQGQALSPVAVLGGHYFTSIAAGVEHTCAVATNGAVYCWGRNTDEDRLGVGSPEYYVTTPMKVGGEP